MDKKVSKYKFVEGEAQIQGYIDAGFVLYGSPMLKNNGGGGRDAFFQAMVLYAEEPVKSKK